MQIAIMLYGWAITCTACHGATATLNSVATAGPWVDVTVPTGTGAFAGEYGLPTGYRLGSSNSLKFQISSRKYQSQAA